MQARQAVRFRLQPGRLGSGLFGVLALAACTDRGPRKMHREVVATVNAEPLYADAVSEPMQSLLAEAGGEAIDPAQLQTIKRRLVERRVEHLLLLGEARRRHLSVANSEIELELARMKKEKGRDFPGFVKDQFGETADLKADIEERLLLARFLAEELEPRILISDQELSKYYADHVDDFRKPERVQCRQIFSTTEDGIDQVYRQLLKGGDFETLARSFSEGREASTGGDLGIFSRGEMPEIMDKQCFSLRDGVAGKPVTSDYGWHIFKPAKHFPAEAPAFDAIKAEVIHKVHNEKRDKLLADLLHDLQEKAQVVVNEKLLEKL